MKKTEFSIIGLSCLIFIALVIYFIGGITGVNPPIKKYEYFGSIDQLVYGIKKYVLVETNITYEFTDTVGNKDNGYAIYMNIALKRNAHSVIYDVKLNEKKDRNDDITTEIKIIGAHDISRHIGGYQIEDPGVKALISDFDTCFFKPLKNHENIQIISFD